MMEYLRFLWAMALLLAGAALVYSNGFATLEDPEPFWRGVAAVLLLWWGWRVNPERERWTAPRRHGLQDEPYD